MTVSNAISVEMAQKTTVCSGVADEVAVSVSNAGFDKINPTPPRTLKSNDLESPRHT